MLVSVDTNSVLSRLFGAFNIFRKQLQILNLMK